MIDLLEIINNQINRNIYHGASLALFKDGQWSEHYIGTIDGVTPIKSGLIYDLASVSKVVWRWNSYHFSFISRKIRVGCAFGAVLS